jgi:transcriptional regulator with XRE-family HTH domain
MSTLQDTLVALHLRLQVNARRRLVQEDLAKLAQVSQRTISEWMRGATEPMAMCALLNLLAALPSAQVEEVLNVWRDAQSRQAVSKQQSARRASLDAQPRTND